MQSMNLLQESLWMAENDGLNLSCSCFLDAAREFVSPDETETPLWARLASIVQC